MDVNMLSSTIDSYSIYIYVFSLPAKPLAGQKTEFAAPVKKASFPLDLI